jgi:predicted nucleic acid-binding Zn finger protein
MKTTSPKNRLQKAYRLLAGNQVARQENGTYVVMSESNEGYYMVNPGQPAMCTCPDFEHRSAHDASFRCSHIWAATIAELVRSSECNLSFSESHL